MVGTINNYASEHKLPPIRDALREHYFTPRQDSVGLLDSGKDLTYLQHAWRFPLCLEQDRAVISDELDKSLPIDPPPARDSSRSTTCKNKVKRRSVSSRENHIRRNKNTRQKQKAQIESLKSILCGDEMFANEAHRTDTKDHVTDQTIHRLKFYVTCFSELKEIHPKIYEAFRRRAHDL